MMRTSGADMEVEDLYPDHPSPQCKYCYARLDAVWYWPWGGNIPTDHEHEAR
jgi:hypothetical protein